MDTTRTICCNFSNKHHNRILIDQSRIKKIMFPEEKLFARMEDISGQVFIQAKSLAQEPTFISVISSEGVVQDIEITFSDCPSQVIMLKEKKEPAPPCKKEPLISHYPIDCTVAAILKGKMPLGYVSMPFRRAVFKPKLGLSAKLVGRLRGTFESLCIYEINNTGICKRKIFEKELSTEGVFWVFLEKNCLEPKETTIAVVAVRNE